MDPDLQFSASELEALRRSSLTLTSLTDREELLVALTQQAVLLVDAGGGGVYEYDNDRGVLTVIADYLRPHHRGTSLKLGEGLAGHLVESHEPYLFCEDYSKSPFRAAVYSDDAFGSVLEVPLKFHQTVLGVLYLDDEVGRAFSSREVELVKLFADQAATALTTTSLLSENADKLRKLSRLSIATREIVESLNEPGLQRQLDLITRHATRILNAEACGVHLVKEEGYLSLEASHGHAEGGFQQGRRLAIRQGRRVGLTGAIAAGGELANLAGEELLSHPSVVSPHSAHVPSGKCCALLALPLTRDARAGKSLVGLIRVDNKENEAGQVDPHARFSAEDEWILRLFGETIVASLEAAAATSELFRKNEQLEQVVRLLETLDESSRYVRGTRNPRKVLEEVVRLATRLVDASAGLLFLHHSSLSELELYCGFEKPDSMAAVQSLGLGRRVATSSRPWDKLIESRRATAFSKGAEGCEWLDLFPGWEYAIGVALEGVDGVDGVLLVGVPTGGSEFVTLDCEVLGRFSVNASIALQTSRLLSVGERMYERLATLQRISRFVQTLENSRSILYCALTGITADYGLRLNRAVAFLLSRRGVLEARAGIGQVTEEEWKVECAGRRRERPVTLTDFLSQTKEGLVGETPVDRVVEGLRIDREEQGNAFASVVAGKRAMQIEAKQYEALPRSFLDCLRPTSTVLVAPLMARGRVLGLIVVDNKFTQAPFGEGDLSLLGAFANTAAIAIDNVRLLRESQRSGRHLRALFKASAALTAGTEPAEVLRQLVNEIRTAGMAASAVAFLQEAGLELERASSGDPGGEESAWSEESLELVLATGRTSTLPAAGGPNVWDGESAEQDVIELWLPLTLADETLGAVAIGYPGPRDLEKADIEGLQLFANQAAVAYDSSRRVERLELLHSSTQALARVTRVEDVLETLVDEAKKIFKASSVTVWSYDAERARFIPEQVVSSGLSEDQVRVFRELEPFPEGTTYTVLDSGWVAVEDVQLASGEFLKPEMRQLLLAAGTKSFAGVRIRAAQEDLGVLYVSFAKPSVFRRGFREMLESFARVAGLELKRARLAGQLALTRETTEIAAKLTRLGRHEQVLTSIVSGAQAALGSDAVVLYAYDRLQERWRYPPLESGVRFPDRLMRRAVLPQGSVVREIVRMKSMLVVDNVEDHRLFCGRRFAEDEEIRSCVAIPLAVEGSQVGVLFVNYRRPVRFTSVLLTSMQLFADQVAIAIGNAQLFQEKARDLSTQVTLLELSSALQTETSAEKIARLAVEAGGRVVDSEYCDLVLPGQGGELLIAAAKGWPEKYVQEYPLLPGRRSQTGYTRLVKEPVFVSDYAKEQRFIVPDIVGDEGITCGMSVPVRRGDEVVGAMLVHRREAREFSGREALALGQIANEASIAMTRARELSRSKQKSAYLGALYNSAKVLTASLVLEQGQFLSEILQQAVSCIATRHGARGLVGTFQRYDSKRGQLVLEAVRTEDLSLKNIGTVGAVLAIDGSGGRKRGIAGRCALSGNVQIVEDVRSDPDYVELASATKSEMACPLFLAERVSGVLNLESTREAFFDLQDAEAIKALLEIAALGVEAGKQYETLRRSKGVVGSHIALSWIAITESHYRHRVSNSAAVIASMVTNLRDRIGSKILGADRQWFEVKLKGIEDYALSLPSFAPTTGMHELALVDCAALVHERVRQLRDDPKYQDLHFELYPQVRAVPRVAANYEWLRNAMDILVDNAIREVQSVEPRRRTVQVLAGPNEKWVEISVVDQGRGIPESIQQQLFMQPVSRQEDSVTLERNGIGLLLAQAICGMYEGEIIYTTREGEGTKITLRLPAVEETASGLPAVGEASGRE